MWEEEGTKKCPVGVLVDFVTRQHGAKRGEKENKVKSGVNEVKHVGERDKDRERGDHRGGCPGSVLFGSTMVRITLLGRGWVVGMWQTVFSKDSHDHIVFHVLFFFLM